jgi:hypothetical protein
MKAFHRRRRVAPKPILQPGPESHVAVGALSGIPPAEVDRYVLLVTTTDGALSLTATACNPAAMVIITTAAGMLAQNAYAGHYHGGTHD